MIFWTDNINFRTLPLTPVMDALLARDSPGGDEWRQHGLVQVLQVCFKLTPIY